MQIKLLIVHQIIELKSEVTKCCENVEHRNLHALLKERYTGSCFVQSVLITHRFCIREFAYLLPSH